ncbi:CHAP domain-containing protein [Rhodococcus jostii]
MVLLLTALGAVFVLQGWQPWQGRAIIGTRLHTFPAVDSADLTATQARVVEIAEHEFDGQASGLKYSDGVDEPWCADFVSWVMLNADQPLTNPNTGSWRIPGVATLEDFYSTAGRLRTAASGYQPNIGDVVLYNEASPFGQHTNIVLSNDQGVLTTIGGNEGNDIRIHQFVLADTTGIVGFGV